MVTGLSVASASSPGQFKSTSSSTTTTTTTAKKLLGLFIVVILLIVLPIWSSSKIIHKYLPSETDFLIQNSTISSSSSLGQQHGSIQPNSLPKFYMIAPPLVTDQLLLEHSDKASQYYGRALNEESAEIWIHRGFQTLLKDFLTEDPNEADIFLLGGYLHLWKAVMSTPSSKAKKSRNAPLNHSFLAEYEKSIVDPSKPHLLLIPSWNPEQSRKAGIKSLVEVLSKRGVKKLWSVGFERNPFWQWLEPDHIVPIPYVIKEANKPAENHQQLTHRRKKNFIFYAGDPRPHAKGWSGCHRDAIVERFQNQTINTDLDVRLISKQNRLSQSDYNYRMATSEYCLILCGDTPTSRSLTSAIVSGCIPLVVGSRLRGLCEPPCKTGFGWRVTGTENPHLPYPKEMAWADFPEVNEQELLGKGISVVNSVLSSISDGKKDSLQKRMGEHKSGWIYGWGDPTNSTDFGSAVLYIYKSFVEALRAVDSSAK